MRRKHVMFVIMILVMTVAIGPVFAGGGDYRDKVTSDNYAERATFRLIHGIMNLGLSWTQIFVEPYNSVAHEDQDIVNGLVDGIAGTAYYALLGAWDIGTFWFPGEAGKELSVTQCVIGDNMNKS